MCGKNEGLRGYFDGRGAYRQNDTKDKRLISLVLICRRLFYLFLQMGLGQGVSVTSWQDRGWSPGESTRSTTPTTEGSERA